MNFRTFRTLCMSFAFLLVGLTGIQAQSEHSYADVVDLLPDAIQVAADLQILNPAIRGTYGVDDINSAITDDIIDQLAANYSSLSDYDKVKLHYYKSVKSHSNNWAIPPENLMLMELKPAGDDIQLTDSQLKDLYEELRAELDQI